MFKKVLISFILVSTLIASFSHFSDAFSQPNIRLRAIRKGEKIYIRVLTPSDITTLRAEIYTSDNELKGIVYKDYYGIVQEYGIKYNEFIISNNEVDFIAEDIIKLFSNIDMDISREISSIPFKTVKEGDNLYKGKLKTMTYNIHHGKDKVGNDNLGKVIDLIRTEDADIIGLQEVDKNMVRSNFRDQLKEVADSLSMYYVYNPNLKIFNSEYGNGLLSKYPIIDWQNIIMPGKEDRGFIRATILVNDSRVNVIVTHLGLDYEEREKHYKIIRPYLEIYDDNLIIQGDFNTLDNDINILNLEKKFNDTASITSNRYMPTLNIFKSENRIDYIFITKNIKVLSYNAKKVQYSDHYPVISELEIR